MTRPLEGWKKAHNVRGLGAWPVLAPFAAHILWWVLGIGDFVWLLAGLIIIITWIGTQGLRVPPAFELWLLFVLWVGVTIVMVDTQGRALGAIYRLLLYLAATAFAFHVYNSRRALTLWRVTGAMVLFLAGMTVCGYLAFAFPELTIRTPMAWIMPKSLASNELISDMIIRRTTQWNPHAWVAQSVRPAAPFLYANTWGNVYSLVLPLALIHLWLAWRTPRRWWVLAVIVLSIVPAVGTLNRGMFIGLGVVGAWVALQTIRRGKVAEVIVGALVVALGGVLWALSTLGEAFFRRVETTKSTVDRWELYRQTLQRTLESPLWGYGAPRPAPVPWLPSMGTQGQLWTVVYSHGFVGALFFFGFFLWVLYLAFQRTDIVGAILGGIVAATIVETTYYGMMTGIMVTMVAIGLLFRDDTIVSSSDRPQSVVRRVSTPRRPSRTVRS